LQGKTKVASKDLLSHGPLTGIIKNTEPFERKTPRSLPQGTGTMCELYGLSHDISLSPFDNKDHFLDVL
jgi:hypothetical protein